MVQTQVYFTLTINIWALSLGLKLYQQQELGQNFESEAHSLFNFLTTLQETNTKNTRI